MQKVKSILGYSWSALALPVILATFVGMHSWTEKLAQVTQVKVSPWFTGGEVVRTLPHEGYVTRIHRPVFDGLLGERRSGFVQVDWVAPKFSTGLPAQIAEEIDWDGDGRADFSIQLDTTTDAAVLSPLSPRVTGSEKVIRLERQRTVRVLLENRPQ